MLWQLDQFIGDNSKDCSILKILRLVKNPKNLFTTFAVLRGNSLCCMCIWDLSADLLFAGIEVLQQLSTDEFLIWSHDVACVFAT